MFETCAANVENSVLSGNADRGDEASLCTVCELIGYRTHQSNTDSMWLVRERPIVALSATIGNVHRLHLRARRRGCPETPA